MAEIIALPTAAAQPVINPKRQGTPPRNVVKRAILNSARMRRRQALERQLDAPKADRVRAQLQNLIARRTDELDSRQLNELFEHIVGRIVALRFPGRVRRSVVPNSP